MKYSPSSGGFYSPSLGNAPVDAVDINDELYTTLMVAQSQGKIISWDEQTQLPAAVEPPAPTVEQLAEAVRNTRDCRMLCALDLTGKYTTQQALISSGGTVASPITEQEYISVLQYIEDLRNIPQQPGFPWNGPDDVACPWPTKPACVCDMSITE
jgi:hypothetical protein